MEPQIHEQPTLSEVTPRVETYDTPQSLAAQEIGTAALSDIVTAPEVPVAQIVAGRITGLGQEALAALRNHPLYISDDPSGTRARSQSAL